MGATSRRGLLKVGLGAAALLAVGGGLATLLQPALQATLKQGRLTTEARRLVGALAEAVLQGSLPAGEAALQRQIDAFETTVGKLPAAARAELAQLLGLLLSAAGRALLTGQRAPLHELGLAERQALLQGMRVSRLALRQQAYFALRDLNAASFFAEPHSWAALAYPGPRAL
jgi:hypothetical protein